LLAPAALSPTNPSSISQSSGITIIADWNLVFSCASLLFISALLLFFTSKFA
jgi:hypothetical protein